MPLSHRCPAPVALAAASLLSAQLATFEDLVRDELGCDVDDVVIEGASDAGVTPELVAARLRSTGACDIDPAGEYVAPRPRRVWWPSRVTLDAASSVSIARDVVSRGAVRTRAVFLRLTWSLGRSGR